MDANAQDQFAQVIAQVQELTNVLLIPQQTPVQVSAGELNYVQTRDVALRAQQELAGDPTNGVMSMDQLRTHSQELQVFVPEVRQKFK